MAKERQGKRKERRRQKDAGDLEHDSVIDVEIDIGKYIASNGRYSINIFICLGLDDDRSSVGFRKE